MRAMDARPRALGLPVGEFPAPLRPKRAAQVTCFHKVLAPPHTDVRTESKMSAKKVEMRLKKELLR